MRLLIVLLSLVLSFCARAADGPSFELEPAGYSENGAVALFALKVTMPAGWHSYWFSPGEGGLPPDLATSPAAEIGWPVPERFEAGSVETVGYRSSFVAPVAMAVRGAETSMQLAVRGTFYACSVTCVPFKLDLSATAGLGRPGADRIVLAALARIPRHDDRSIRITALERTDAGYRLTFTTSGSMIGPAAFLDLGPKSFASLSTMKVEGRMAVAEFTLADGGPEHAGPQTVRVVATDGVSAVDTDVSPTSPFDLTVIFVALAGGLILNAMPCVFPVLAIKMFAVLSQPPLRQRSSHLASATGIIAAFCCLGATIICFRAAGMAFGWGMQFQNPVFCGLMALVVFVSGVSLLGIFEVMLPSSVATKLVGSTEGTGTAAAFFQGFVLTVLATPCSAPFVGSAVAYALSRDVVAALCVFAAMGAGMSLPLIVLAVFPAAARMLPRPGRWMVHVRTFAAASMFAAAGWLATLGPSTVVAPLLAMAMAGVMAVVWKTGGKVLPAAVCATAFAAAFALVATPPGPKAEGVAWRSFSPVAVSEALAAGRTVFVDVTADWCLTCKINERGVLSDSAVVAALNGAATLRGDWTRPDPEILRLLTAHGRFGIPFYLVLGPRNPEGILLSEVPSRAEILRALEKVR